MAVDGQPADVIAPVGKVERIPVVIPAGWVARIHLKQPKDGCLMANVEYAVFLPHPRKWLAGIHLRQPKDGCPLTTVGHDGWGKMTDNKCWEWRGREIPVWRKNSMFNMQPVQHFSYTGRHMTSRCFTDYGVFRHSHGAI
jgi:hypothetical protein